MLAQAGPLDGKIVIDTTNQFGREGWEDLGDAHRRAGQRRADAGSALHEGVQHAHRPAFRPQAAGRTGPDRVVMFLCGDDEEAKRVVAGLIDDAGFTPVDMGAVADAAPMEAPRREGAVYGEEFHEQQARDFVAGLRSS